MVLFYFIRLLIMCICLLNIFKAHLNMYYNNVIQYISSEPDMVHFEPRAGKLHFCFVNGKSRCF